MHRAPDRLRLAAGLAVAVALLAAAGGEGAEAPDTIVDGPPRGVGSSTGTGARSRSASG